MKKILVQKNTRNLDFIQQEEESSKFIDNIKIDSLYKILNTYLYEKKQKRTL